ncbi:DNA-3-methyladenine glycosylase I [Agathobacter rectalis]|uniref:DNA-3-methyladenine glycosylase I n=1 Tax=Agathobacter rectalis TaxID=39491 RepID=A0A412Q0Q9_9FIRM|nr:DNA-3-methyladenine glycosylase I [Agathobacter rectalis]RGT73958.1 DNA-3-methyladenine glycosylase I [Agathobacter rectalis]RGT79276.1 DNA-3-methyladenine glycosylase I [Agathobacter rectalis]
MNRCVWCLDSEVMLQYHDEEWGKPLHDDRKHFEYLLMEVMQCGLNWNMMLKKRDIFKKCFDNYDYNKIANYDDFKIESIMNTDGMIKSKKKILAIVNNARAFLKIIDEFGSFDNYIWSFSNYRIMVYHKHQQGYEEVKNSLSDRLSCDLKKRGFKYLGSITIFSHLQACGIINDHDCNCFRYQELLNENSAFIVYE